MRPRPRRASEAGAALSDTTPPSASDEHGAAPGHGLGAVLVLGAAALWASFGLFAKVLYARGYAPLELASVRALVGMLGAALWIARRPASLKLDRRGVLFYAFYGVLGFAVFETMYFAALERTSVAIAAALLYTAPAFVVLASRLIWHEHIPVRKVVALVMVLAGVLLVTGALNALRTGTAHLSGSALLLGIGAGAGYAGYTLFSKFATQRYRDETSLFWSFAFATLALAFFAPPFRILLREPADLPMLLALGVVPTLLPYALYLGGLRRLRASTAAMLASLEPVIAALLAVALLGEALDTLRVIGIALIVGAAVLIAREIAPSTAT